MIRETYNYMQGKALYYVLHDSLTEPKIFAKRWVAENFLANLEAQQ